MSIDKLIKNEIEDIRDKIKIFSNFIIPTKYDNIKIQINKDTANIKLNHKILKTVEYGNDPDFRKYMLYLANMRKKEEEEYLEYLRQKNKKDPLLSKLDVNKKISFPDFIDKFKINSYLMNYFDYYEIQKINKKQTAELIRQIKERIRKEKDKENKKEIEIGDNNIDKSYTKFKRRISLINIKNLKKEEKRLSIENMRKNNLDIEGIDFDLFQNLFPEIEENEKKLQYLSLINELKKEKKKFQNRLNRMPRKKAKTEGNFKPDKYTIAHSLDNKNQKKLNRLKLLIKKRLDKDRPKTTKTISYNELKYLNYIPNTSKYKHINYHKNLIFNNEFYNNGNKNKDNKLNNNIKTEPNKYKENNLLTKSNRVINNLTKIKSLLKQDKNYTSKTINRANTAFKRKDNIKADQRFMENLMKDNKKNINKIKAMKEKMKNKDKFHVFEELNEITKKSDKNNIEVTDIFSRTLNGLCKEEKKENKKYNNFIKHNYFLKIEGIIEDNLKKEGFLENLEHIQHSYEKIKFKIKKRCKEINNIIKESKKKSKNF